MLRVNVTGPAQPDKERVARPPSDDDVFEVFFTGQSGSFRAIKMEGGLGWRPAMNVYETEGELVVQVELAGLRRQEIVVEVEGRLLTIRGDRTESDPGVRRHYHKLEIGTGQFERHVRLPGHVDSSHVTARYESGFLYVVFPDGEGIATERTSIDIESR